jgi:hypothetical protein
MVLQKLATVASSYRTSFETSGANDRQIVELHWRDFAVFVSLSSRTNTRQGCAYATLPAALLVAREQVPILF